MSKYIFSADLQLHAVSRYCAGFQIVKRLASQGDADSKLLAYKMAGNLGDPELSPLLEAACRDKSSSTIHRVEAIASMKKTARQDPDKV